MGNLVIEVRFSKGNITIFYCYFIFLFIENTYCKIKHAIKRIPSKNKITARLVLL